MIKKYLEFIKESKNKNIIPKSIEELEEILKENGIKTKDYGKGSAKTIEHLFNEIKNDECSIRIEDDEIIRNIEFVGIEIFHDDLRLKEDYQKFKKDNRVRKRDSEFSVAEKMIEGENAVEAAIRGVKEELGIDIKKEQLKKKVENKLGERKDSNSYPGLHTIYRENSFTCVLTDDQYNEDGYVENQKDKSTYFKWIKIK